MSNPLHDFTDAEHKTIHKMLKRFEQLRDEWQDSGVPGAQIVFPIVGTTNKMFYFGKDAPLPVYIDADGYPRTPDWAQQEIWELVLPRRIDPPHVKEDGE